MRSYQHKCQCETCTIARQREKKDKHRPPRHVMNEWMEKKMKEEEAEMWAGIMVIQCPYCRHYSKVKVKMTNQCPKCLTSWR